MSLAEKMHFLQIVSQMTAMVLVINHYHIDGLYLVWDILYFHVLLIDKTQ